LPDAGIGRCGSTLRRVCLHEWYGSAESVRVAENVLLYQRDTGGWPKNTAMHKPLTEPEKAKVTDDKGLMMQSLITAPQQLR